MQSIRRFLPYISAILIIYGAVGVAVNLRLIALIIGALTGWLGPSWSAFAAPIQLSFLAPLQAHFDARPWLPWAAWLVGAALLPFFPRPISSYAADAAPVEQTAAPKPTSSHSRWVVVGALALLLLVGGVARMVELWPQDYGITRFPYDDEGVYAGAAQLFLQGEIPYRDYFFAHPPIAAISYAPAMLYHFTEWGSPTSFMMARYLSVFYSLVTLALIFLIAYRLAGLGGGIISGLLWAVDGRVVEINRKIMLEGPLVLLSCAAVLLYLWARPALYRGDTPGPKRPLLILGFAGAVAALSALTKIAGLACLLAIVIDMVWIHLENRRKITPYSSDHLPIPLFGRQFAAILLGVLISVAVVLGPFLLLAPSQFVREVLFFQLLRPADGVIDTPARIADLTSTLGNALTPLLAALGFAVLSVWMWFRRTPGPWRIGILWTFFSLLLFTYSRSFYQHYYIQLAAPLAMLGAGVSLAWRVRHQYRVASTEYRVPSIDDRALAEPQMQGARFGFTNNLRNTQYAVRSIPVLVLCLLVLPLLLLQWSGLVTRNCPHCEDPMFVVVGRYVNDAVPPGATVLATDEQFNLMAARPPSHTSTGYLIDSYGHMIYLGLNLGNRDWGDLFSASLRGDHGNDAYAVMHLPVPQADILDRARQAAMTVIHDRGFARLTDETIAALSTIAKPEQQQARYTIYRK
ncbi:MAG: hypothetical protein ABI670_13500 [Chloroflexota bacterium]